MNPFGVLAAAKLGKALSKEVRKASESGFSESDVFLEPEPAAPEAGEGPKETETPEHHREPLATGGYRDNARGDSPANASPQFAGARRPWPWVLFGITGIFGSILARAGVSMVPPGSAPMLFGGAWLLALGISALVWKR